MKKQRIEDMTTAEINELYDREVKVRQIKKTREKNLKDKAWTVILLIGIAIYIILEVFG